MKIGTIAASIALTLAASATAFVTPSSQSVSSTQLYISSWGAKGPPSRWKKEEDPDPEKKIQSYLKAPEPIAARDNLSGTVLVSGWVNNKERTDQTIFNFLNEEESAFNFDKIVAFVDDAKFAKKRLISRSSRYSGLLDKLDFTEAESAGALPTVEQLEGVTSWVVNAVKEPLETIKAVADLASKAADVKNVAVLVTDAQTLSDSAAAKEAVDALAAVDSIKYTIVAVGAIIETPEGKVPYGIAEFGTEEGLLLSNATYSRDESLRVVAECLGLASACNKAIVLTEVNDVNATEFKLVKGLREGGYTRPQEIDHMITKGPEVSLLWQSLPQYFIHVLVGLLNFINFSKAYAKAIEDYKTRVPSITPQDEWLAQKQKELDEDAVERKERIKQEYEQKKQEEIENIAREWAKREFFRKATSGDMPYSEEEYIKSVWERAMFEGDLKYRMLHGQETDERKELAEFKKKQEKKKAMMLERAQNELNKALGEDGDKLVPAGEDKDDDE